jgi:hypothetical protein
MGQPDPLVIVGTGLAGYAVARELRKLDGDTPLVIVSRDDGSFYSKPSLSNALAMKKAPSELAGFDAQAMAAQLRAQIWTYRQVERIAHRTRDRSRRAAAALSCAGARDRRSAASRANRGQRRGRCPVRQRSPRLCAFLRNAGVAPVGRDTRRRYLMIFRLTSYLKIYILRHVLR